MTETGREPRQLNSSGATTKPRSLGDSVTARPSGPAWPTIDEVVESAIGHFEAGRLEQAQSACERLLRDLPEHDTALHLSGLVEHHHHRHEQAAQLIEAAVRKNPRSAVYHNNLGECYRHLHHGKRALQEYLHAIRLDQRYAQPHVNLGMLCHSEHRLEYAAKAFVSALAIEPSSALYNNLAVVLCDMGEYRDALVQFHQALRLEPDNAVIEKNIARVERQLKRSNGSTPTSPDDSLMGYDANEASQITIAIDEDTVVEFLGVMSNRNESDASSDVPRGDIYFETDDKGATDRILPGQTANLGFWRNESGHQLIEELDAANLAGANPIDPADSAFGLNRLGSWLVRNFPNIYGPGPNDLTRMSATGMADRAQDICRRRAWTSLNQGTASSLDAHVLAVALAVFVTNENLAGQVASAFGFLVDNDGLGARVVNVGTNSTAFGIAAHSRLTVMDLLRATNLYANRGVLYDLDNNGRCDTPHESAIRSMAEFVYAGINTAGDI